MRVLAILALLLLANCSTTRIITASVENPVTAEKMYQVEQAAIVVISGLNTYKDLCVKRLIDQKCRSVVVQIQSFTRPAAGQLVTLRRYFRNNDRLNAIGAYNTLIQLMADARAVAVANGVVIQ